MLALMLPDTEIVPPSIRWRSENRISFGFDSTLDRIYLVSEKRARLSNAPIIYDCS